MSDATVDATNAPMNDATNGTSARIALTLVSHTNAGKTTLARTLLGKDIGEVRDEAHVTEVSDEFLLVATPERDALTLWDTPGFSDSARLARRLEQSGISWMIAQAWDRYRDRPLWSSQQAIRSMRDHADVVLYLVNSAEDPADAGYIEPELRILDWIGKPVIVLLNQMGAPRAPSDEAAEIDRWRSLLQRAVTVRAVLALDAFARCWVQEVTLFETVGALLPEARRESFARLLAAWRHQREATFLASIDVLAKRIARTAVDREVLPKTGLLQQLRSVGAAIGIGGKDDDKRRAMRALAERLDDDIRGGTARLIALHGLGGEATQRVLARLAEHYAVTRPIDEGRAALFGGLVTGSLAGLKADLATGGLSHGGGMVAGGILGALGAAGLAKGYNLLRGSEAPSVVWSDAVLEDLTVSALLGYLAVAHYGRGRGDWSESEHPPHWEQAVRAALEPHRAALQATWRRRDAPEAEIVTSLQPLLADLARDVLTRLYPAMPIALSPAHAANTSPVL
jgi:hypothetical protein